METPCNPNDLVTEAEDCHESEAVMDNMIIRPS